jgi:hypothetical protein
MENCFSYIMEGEFMSCRLLFVLCEEYSLLSYEKKIWTLLGIRADTWSKYKNERKLPLSQYKKICDLLGMSLTDDDQIICQNIFNNYFSDKEGQYER